MNEMSYRTCVVLDENDTELYEALFHGFYARSEIVPPSPLRGGHTGGVVADVIALVEDRCGTVVFVTPNRVAFTDDLAQLMIDYKNIRNKEINDK